MSSPTLADIREAARRIAPHAHRTPCLSSRSLDQLSGTRLYFKCENLQKAGAFKFRGAANAILSLPDEEACLGVATHSSGNHAGALALAAQIRGIKAHIVMPENAPKVKKAATAGYGGQIHFCEPTLAAREALLARVLQETGATFVHPYNNPDIIAGQGTAALELLDQIPELDAVVAPVGGGGLLSGTCVAAKGLKPGVNVYGAEPEVADDAARSMAAGKILPSNNPRSIADGLLTSLGSETFPILREHTTAILTASQTQPASAMRLIWERMKILVEPSGAVTLAVVLANPATFAGRQVGLILSGGNVDLDRLPWQQ